MNRVQIVEAYFGALSSGDIEKAFSFFDANATWSQPGNNQFSGVKNGPGEIGTMLGHMMENSEGSLVVAPAGPLMESDHLVAAPVRFTGTKGSAKMDLSGIDLFEVTDGKITKVWLFSEDQDKEDEFWGN